MTEISMKFFKIEIKEQRVRQLLIAEAISEINKSKNGQVDMSIDPSIQSDNYRGYIVYVKKDEK